MASRRPPFVHKMKRRILFAVVLVMLGLLLPAAGAHRLGWSQQHIQMAAGARMLESGSRTLREWPAWCANRTYGAYKTYKNDGAGQRCPCDTGMKSRGKITGYTKCNCGDCCDARAHEDGWNYDCGYMCNQRGCDDYEDTAILTVAVCTARRT